MIWLEFDGNHPLTGKFLALNKDKDIAVVWWEGEHLIRGGWFGSCEYGCGGHDFFEDITHWAPLPQNENEI